MADSNPRANERIQAPKVRLVGSDGNQLGIKDTAEAIAMAKEQDLDLVEVAHNANPPVCRILDYNKYKYVIAQKEKESRKRRTQIVVKEMKYRPKISQGDLDTKTRKVIGFLNEGNRVKITVMFRGREVDHPELGQRIIDHIKEASEDLATVEVEPSLNERNMTMILMPDKNKLKLKK